MVTVAINQEVTSDENETIIFQQNTFVSITSALKSGVTPDVAILTGGHH